MILLLLIVYFIVALYIPRNLGPPISDSSSFEMCLSHERGDKLDVSVEYPGLQHKTYGPHELLSNGHNVFRQEEDGRTELSGD